MRKTALTAKSIISINFLSVLLIGPLFALAVLIALPVKADNEKNANGQWKQYKNEDGIMGFERDVKRSKYIETRAETVIDAPIEVLLEVLKDINSYPQWMYDCKDAILLKQKGELKRVLYFAQGVPFGSPDRDSVIEAVTAEDFDKGVFVTNLRNIDHHPYQQIINEHGKKRRRMIEFSGKWDLQMIDRNRTKVSNTIYTNPGGFAPAFIVNRVTRKVGFRSLKSLISKAKEQKYIDAAEKGRTKMKIDTAIKKGRLVFAVSSKKVGVHSPQ